MVSACVAARCVSTPSASDGLTQRSDRAVMMPSRPNTVLNQGTPAYGYAPSAVSVVIMRTSALERVIHSLNLASEVSIDAYCRRYRSSRAESALRAASADGVCDWRLVTGDL